MRFGAFTIWIDALCINQKDNRDKEQQISRMGGIYAQASATYIWLGESDKTSKRVFDYFSRAGFLRFYFDKPDDPSHRIVNPRLWAAILFYMWTRRSSMHSPIPYRNSGRSEHLPPVRVRWVDHKCKVNSDEFDEEATLCSW
jgi:hypothetical protein